MANRSSLKAQIAEVEREIAMRESLYPSRVASRAMRAAEAELHLSRMRDVLETLKWLERNERAIRAALSSHLDV